MTTIHPLIGLPVENNHPANAQFTLLRVYCNAIALGGGVPTLIPLLEDEALLRALYDRLDGVCLVGGGDVAPERYGSTHPELALNLDRPRDAVEGALCRWALAEDKPLLAICRGIQMLNVAAGGTLYEDIATQIPGALQHATPRGMPPGQIKHTVAVERDSLLVRLLGVQGENAGRLPVNSRHHQALRDVAPGLHVTARAPDGVVEAVEAGEGGRTRIVGVQWHPECMLPESETMARLFEGSCTLCADEVAGR